MCKHTKCCFNRKHHSPWGIPDYLGFLPGCRHKLGKVRSVILIPNTWHCQTSCNHEMRWRGLPRRNAGDENTLPRFCLPVSSRLSRSTRTSPSQQPRVELGGDLAISEGSKSDRFWKHITARYLTHRFDASNINRLCCGSNSSVLFKYSATDCTLGAHLEAIF